MVWWETARATAGRPMSLFIWKALGRLGVGDGHVHEVVGLPEQPPYGDHLVEGDDGGLELLDGAPVRGGDADGDDDLDAHVLSLGGVSVAYASRADRPELPFWPLLFADVTPRLLGSDDFPQEAKRQAVVDVTRAARAGALSFSIAELLPLDRIAAAHDLVDAGSNGRVLLAIP
jgi:hypothetical protein